MALAPRLLNLVVCPRCHGKLQDDAKLRLKCPACQVSYPIRDNVPHLVTDEAQDARPGGKSAISVSQNAVRFREKRPNAAARTFYLESGTCKVIGRPPGDPNKTTVMHIDLPLVLDEGTKGVVQQYIQKQFGQLAEDAATPTTIGHFRRTADIVLDDSAVSRLHAMVFYDGNIIGVLDLVSKNGTFVNGQEVESKILKLGDVVEIGDTKIAYEG